MIVLLPGETLQAVLAAAPATTNPTFSFAYGDDGTATALGSAKGALTGTTALNAVTAPATGSTRVVRSGFIYNADTADVAVTVKHNNGTNAYPLVKVTLPAGNTLILGDNGWRVVDGYGAAPVSRPADASAFGPQSANQFLAGPVSGAPATSAFRGLATQDLSSVVLDGGNF